MGVAEEALEDVAHLGAAGLVLSDTGAVEKGSAILPVPDVALFLEDAEGGEDRGVGKRVVRGKRLNEIGDGGGAARPEQLHESELGFGERDGLLGRHGDLVLRIETKN